jgi:hypothetical protein
VRVTRLYTGEDGQSHFEELELPLTATEIGAMSSAVPTTSVFFRDTANGGPEVIDYHVAPRRQFVIHLAGAAEIEVGDGTKRRFGVGDVLLADDTTGQGHISREVEGPRVQLFAALADTVDLDRWRTP